MLTKVQRLARERAIIKELRGGELSYRKIAAKFGVSLPTVTAKARKAGIRRRPGARPAAKAAAPIQARAAATTVKARTRSTAIRARAASTALKAAATAARPKARSAAAKIRAGKAALRAHGRARRTGRPRRAAGAQRRTALGARRAERFQEQFRTLVMHHYPNISLARFDRLVKQIARAMA
ncbi:MAG: hypothetical protein FJY75_12385 [Candidatus Eisenbacteria bacterium]|uniref:Uncharacterized protein n=1 Tax=Eiseniibacteriota bacterium TaxID=2212470 RepID=A0A937XBB0_UNCEI|nr:hypothetical protein [Candidatus Eisenbacteria bacterium]